MLLCLPLIVALNLGAAERVRTPWFLPRYALIGGYAGTGVFAPTARIGWEVALVEQKTEFVVALELGPAFGATLPAGMKTFFEHTAMAGVGLRNRRGAQFHWGVSVIAGPIYHGGTFVDSMLNEERWNVAIEGRAQAGLDLGPVSLAIYLGYMQPFVINTRYASALYVGGVAFGVLVNWR